MAVVPKLGRHPEDPTFLIEDFGVREILPRRYNMRVLGNENVEIRIAIVPRATVGATLQPGEYRMKGKTS